MKITTDHIQCRIIAGVLKAHGVKEAVLSPGSRCAPLVLAINAEAEIRSTVIVDERAAAFFALGKALYSGQPVALVCTSGSALLNYAPAVAEAYYRGVPLIILSADRPVEWIDQLDSQTLRQYPALTQVVKHSYDLPSRCDDRMAIWYANRTVNDAMITACAEPCGPVHINVQLDAPLGNMIDGDDSCSEMEKRVIHCPNIVRRLPDEVIHDLTNIFVHSERVVLLGGCDRRSVRRDDAIARICAYESVISFAEPVANCYADITDIDRVFIPIDDKTLHSMTPDLVIVYGGAIVSGAVKQWLRSNTPVHTWRIGMESAELGSIDTYGGLTCRIDMPSEEFFAQLADRIDRSNAPIRSGYRNKWLEIAAKSRVTVDEYITRAPWCDMTAMVCMMRRLDNVGLLHLSNGTTVRYCQITPPATDTVDVECNRGVSGIDGSTSTAIGGATMNSDSLTLLITGDMSARYDIGALYLPDIPSSMRVIVLNNGGGNIFRSIPSTWHMPDLERCFVADSMSVSFKDIAENSGWKYMKVEDMRALEDGMRELTAKSDAPILMEVVTSGPVSADILTGLRRLSL